MLSVSHATWFYVLYSHPWHGVLVEFHFLGVKAFVGA